MENNCCEKKEDVKCCENKDTSKCCWKCACCPNWRKCHMMKRIVFVIVIIVAFCLGTQWGEMHNESRGCRFERNGGMMNFGYGKFDKEISKDKAVTGTVTVDVKAPEALKQ